MTQKDTAGGGGMKSLKSVSLSFKVIESLLELDGATVTELASHLDIPKSTAHVHLKTLRSNGYVAKNDLEYRLSFQFLTIGGRLRMQTKLFKVAKPSLRELARDTEEIVILAIEESGLGTVLYKAESSGAVDDNAPIGTRFLLHQTAMGKAILSRLPEERVEEIVDTVGLPTSTQKTINDLEALREKLREVRERGFAINDEERTSGVRAIGTPLMTTNDEVVGSISISGPKRRLSRDHLVEQLANPLLETKNIIELKLEHY